MFKLTLLAAAVWDLATGHSVAEIHAQDRHAIVQQVKFAVGFIIARMHNRAHEGCTVVGIIDVRTGQVRAPSCSKLTANNDLATVHSSSRN